MYGLLTGTSAYKNSAGYADWVREQLISAFFESKEAEYIANLGLLMVGGMAARNSGPRNSPSEMGIEMQLGVRGILLRLRVRRQG